MELSEVLKLGGAEVDGLVFAMGAVGYLILFAFVKGHLPTPKERAILLAEIKKRDKALERLSYFVFNDIMQLLKETGADVSVVREKIVSLEAQIEELRDEQR